MSSDYSSSAANKDRSTVNYCQSLAFDNPYLSCNDHCDRWLFQEIFFIIFRSSRMQMFFKTGVIRNFVIFTGKHLCWSIFLIKLRTLRPATLFQPHPQKILQHKWFLWKLRNFYEQVFSLNTSGGCFCQFDKVTAPWWASADLLFFIINEVFGMVSIEKICRSVQSMLFTHC